MEFIKRIFTKMAMSKYDNYSIVEYFREQGAIIGDDCYFGIRELASEPYLVMIGNHVQISDDVKFLTHNVGWCFRNEIPDIQVFGAIRILDNCYVGAGTIILPNVTIGPNVIIGAGSVVTKDVPANTVFAGNPARFIMQIDDYKNKAMNIWAEQKPPGYLSDLKPGQKYLSHSIHKRFRLLKNRLLLRKHLIKILKIDRNDF